MKTLKTLTRPLTLAFGWAWAFWAAALYYSRQYAIRLMLDRNLFDLITIKGNRQAAMVHLLFVIGLFGPLLAFVFADRKLEESSSSGKVNSALILRALSAPVIIVLPALLFSALFRYANFAQAGANLVKIPLFFVSSLLTYSAGELCWQGRLYHLLKHKFSLFKLSMILGFIRMLWYLPVAVFLYLDFDKHSNMPDLLCFLLGVFALSYIMAYLHRQSNSLPLLILTHALILTANFSLKLFFPYTFFAFLPALTAWGLVFFLQKEYKAKKVKAP